MIDRISFEELTPTQFEDFCFDLLKALGCTNVNWRKGTGYDSSPSDSGRDIECEYVKRDYLIGETSTEKWFIECKHYKQGVPADKLNNILSWCNAERPQRCVIIASNFLSNSAKDFIESYIDNNKPSFSISIWEKPKLESLTANIEYLLRAHNIVHKDSILDYINPYHSEYIKRCPYNSAESLINALNCLEQNKKMKIFEILTIYYLPELFNKRSDNSHWNNEENYRNIIEKCMRIANETTQHLAVCSFVSVVISSLLAAGNPTTIDSKINETIKTLENIDRDKDTIIQKAMSKLERDGVNIKDIDPEVQIASVKKFYKKSIENMKLRQEEIYDLYNSFCNIVVKNLLENDMM